MKSETDRRIHDYLDGRLGEDEQAEFENRMTQDAELAERVEEYRRIGSALRADETELSPGFYTRTRTAFENRSTGGARRGFRILSWETAGLAVAAGLAMVVFVPGLLRDGTSLPPNRIQKDTTTPASTFADAPAESSEPTLQEKVSAPPPVDRLKQKSDRDEPATTLGYATGSAAPAPPSDEERDDPKKKRVEKEELQFAPPMEAPPTSRQNEERAAGERARSTSLADVAAESSIEVRRAVAWPLPDGAVAPGEVRVASGDRIASGAEDARDAESFRQDKGSLRRAGSLRKNTDLPDAGERHVLIGPREPAFSCVGIEVHRAENVWVIALSKPGPDRPASETGCAVALPDDGTDFRVEGASR